MTKYLISGYLILILSGLGLAACDCDDDPSTSSGQATEDDDAADDDDDDAGDDDISDDDAVDTEPPAVVSTSPANGEVELKLATEVIVAFSEPMDQGSVESSFTLTGIAGSFTWNAAGDEMTFVPDNWLEEDTDYIVIINEGAKDLAGNPMETSYLFSFQTVDLWRQTHDGAAGGYDQGWGIAVDSEGTVYVTGEEDLIGNKGDTGIWVGKYNRHGNVLWTRSYDIGTWDIGTDVALDGASNVFVIGHVENISEDIWLRKLDDESNELWTRTYNGAETQIDRGEGIAVGGNGDVYAIGTEDVDGQFFNIWIRKYDGDGAEQWTYTYDSGFYDEGNAVAVDDEENVYAVGLEAGADIWISKFDSLGSKQWTRLIADYEGAANGVAVDDDGNIYVTGSVKKEAKAGPSNIWVAKYDSDGNLKWFFLWGGELWCQGYDVAVDDENNILAVGACENAWLGKFDVEGNELWTYTDSDATARSVAVDIRGHIYMTGVTDEGDAWIQKLDPDGHWAE